MPSLLLYYFAIKAIFLLGIIRSAVKFDTLLEYPTFLAGLYTGGVAFLSYMYRPIVFPMYNPRDWQIWLLKTFVLAMIYFRLLRRFDDGILFFLVLLLCIPLIVF